METTAIQSKDEPIGDRVVVAVPTEKEYAALDVFGTEAFDSVCGVDILDPFYRPDVKRVISLWSILLLVSTTVLTLGFFGCFRRLKGENLDLSRNLWNEDLFWTSLIHFMLTGLAVTCGLSALASHTNLYSHAKVLGFRRVFRWCLTLHAAAAVFTFLVALKLTVIDFLEPESGVILTTQEKAPAVFAVNPNLKRPKDVFVYPRDPRVANPLTPNSLSRVGLSFLQITTVNANMPKSAENAETTEFTSSRVVAEEAPSLSLISVRLRQHTPPLGDSLQRIPEPSREARKLHPGEPVNRRVLRKEFSRKKVFRSVQKWTADEDLFRIALPQSGTLQKARGTPCPASSAQFECGFGENIARSSTRDFASPHANAETSPSLRESESGAEGAIEKASPLTPAYTEGAHSFVSRPAWSNFSPVPHQYGSRQKNRTAGQLSIQRYLSGSKAQLSDQFTSPPKCAFIDMHSAQRLFPTGQRRNGVSDAHLEQATALPTVGLNKRLCGKTYTRGSAGNQRRQHAQVSVFQMDGSEETGQPADRSTALEVKNELRPVRDSRIYRSMLYSVMALDYSATVLHVVCFMYTWHLASKIGGMFGLKILKIPF